MKSLDVSAPLFGVAEVAEVSGVSRPNIDLFVSQKLVRPTRRIKAARPASAKSRGKPMFSVRAIYIVRLIRELHSLGLSYADSAAIADQTEKAKLSKSDTAKNANKSLTNLLEVTGGNWIAACAESPSLFQRNRVYAYASRIGEKWAVEVHLATTVDQSLSTAPTILIPASDIFFVVYTACNDLLGNPRAANRSSHKFL
jgi:DNA-binding transcriptional MerR regulator